MEAKWLSGDAMWWKNNDTIQKQITDKTLGRIKHQLIEVKGNEIKDVVIRCKKNPVELRKKQVAYVFPDGTFQAKDESEDIGPAVEQYMKAWKAKRNFE